MRLAGYADFAPIGVKSIVFRSKSRNPSSQHRRRGLIPGSWYQDTSRVALTCLRLPDVQIRGRKAPDVFLVRTRVRPPRPSVAFEQGSETKAARGLVAGRSIGDCGIM